MTDSNPEPTPEPPPKPEPVLEYNNSITNPPTPSQGASAAMFIAGLLLGLVVSPTVYALAVVKTQSGAGFVLAIVIVVGLKVSIGGSLIRNPRWASFGKGIIASIGMIVLLVGACFGIVALMK
jgi:hypothetical protein